MTGRAHLPDAAGTDRPARPRAPRPPLLLTPRPSLRLGIFVVLLYVLAAATVLALPLAGAWRLALVAGIAAALGWTLWVRVLGRAPWSIREARAGDDGWELVRRDGRVVSARLRPSSFIGVGVVILSLRSGMLGGPALILTAEAIGDEALRRLRARLRNGPSASDRAAADDAVR